MPYLESEITLKTGKFGSYFVYEGINYSIYITYFFWVYWVFWVFCLCALQSVACFSAISICSSI